MLSKLSKAYVSQVKSGSRPPSKRLLETKDVSVLDKLAQYYQKEMIFWNSYAEDDEILLRGLRSISQAIEGFRCYPV